MKTKQDLLRAMRKMHACHNAIEYVDGHASDDAEAIGLSCSHLEWKLYFLIRKLRRESRSLFARRLGQRLADFYCGGIVSSDWNLRLSPHDGCLPVAHTRPEVIDDCWRAWCRS